MTFRRILLALYSLVFIAACGGLIGLIWNENEKLDLDINNDFNLQAFITATDSAQTLATAVLGVLIVFGLWTLLMALLPSGSRGSSGMLRLKQSDGGTVEMSAQALERLVREEIESLAEVRQAVPRVRVSGGAVETDALVVIDSAASVAHVTTVVNDAINRAFKEQVGVTNVKRPSIRISYDPVKGQPMGEGESVRRMDPQRPISPPRATDPSDPVSWPEPPPDVRRAEAAPSDRPPRDMEDTRPPDVRRAEGAPPDRPPRDMEDAAPPDVDPASRAKPNHEQERE